MIKKIKDLILEEAKEICDNAVGEYCEKCPFYKGEEEYCIVNHLGEIEDLKERTQKAIDRVHNTIEDIYKDEEIELESKDELCI